jgi:hypothetical protein
MGKRYKETDVDIDSTERYFHRFPSINCISFLGQRWRLLEKMEDCERKTVLAEQWQLQLKQFVRMSAIAKQTPCS